MITRPTLIINEKKCRRNIRKMAEKANASGIIFRPHFKTHQSLQVAKWFRDEGVEKITVSSAEMAVKFAESSWNDITIAFPANIREVDIFNDLASKIDLQLLTDSVEVTEALSKGMNSSVGLFIEIDCGYGRSGIAYDNTESIDAVIRAIQDSDQINFRGFLLHSGDTYHAKVPDEIDDIYQRNIHQLKKLKERFIAEFPDIIISMGDTPACSIVDDLSDADEIRPGNFVYYDLMQYYLGVCDIEDIAVSVACPVSGIYHDRNEIVIYGGAIHLSKEFLDQDGRLYGFVVKYTNDGWSSPVSDTRLISISQEHGIIKTTSNFLERIKHGDLLGIIPIHSCLTSNLLKENILVV